jgi:hypothetical protein
MEEIIIINKNILVVDRMKMMVKNIMMIIIVVVDLIEIVMVVHLDAVIQGNLILPNEV